MGWISEIFFPVVSRVWSPSLDSAERRYEWGVEGANTSAGRLRGGMG